MNDNYDRKAIENVLRMVRERRNYWADRYNLLRKLEPESFMCGDADGCANAYETCAQFLELLLARDWECLNQYDYYGD